MSDARPWSGLVLALACMLASAACKTDKQDGGKSEEEAPAAAVATPTSEAAFLAELVPLPEGVEAVEIHYAITGPALRGTMTTTVAAGGARIDRWELSSTVDPTLRSAGTTLVNADHVWSAAEGSAGELRPNHLGALARAYLDLDQDARAAVVESIRSWHAMLAEQRARDQGARTQIQGESCLRTRVAAQNVCMWEEVGVLLRYEGSAFTIEATKIDHSPTLSPDAFMLPRVADGAKELPGETHDYAQILTEIAAGSYGRVSALVVGANVLPSLSVPE